MPEFFAYLTAKRYTQCRDFLRSLGVRQILTDLNHSCESKFSSRRALYDYVDNHLYWDHPRFAEKNWQLPILPGQGQPFQAVPGNPGSLFPTRLFGKPFMVTEYAYSNPNIYHAGGPALMASYASFQDWDALFPFAYAHGRSAVINNNRVDGFFDIASDPVKACAERIGAHIFLHSGLKPAEIRLVADATNPYADAKASPYSPPIFTSAGLVAAIGSEAGQNYKGRIDARIDIGAGHPTNDTKVFTADDKLLTNLIAAGILPKHCVQDKEKRFSTPDGSIQLDRNAGTFLLKAPAAEAMVLMPGTSLAADRLAASKVNTFSTLALLPSDHAPSLAKSKRLLLFHLTNTMSTGMHFASSDLDRMESWGKTPFLAHPGTADVTLTLPDGVWSIHALDFSGKRTSTILSDASGKCTLHLDNFTSTPDGVTFAYEISRKR